MSSRASERPWSSKERAKRCASSGLRPPPKSVTSGAAGLTGREIEIARMVATRKSNKEIGGALQISARTVSTHLSNIFLKLSVGSRGELADFVRQNGLLDG